MANLFWIWWTQVENKEAMTPLTDIDIDYDKLGKAMESDVVRRVRELQNVPAPDEEPTAEDRREAGRRLAGNPDDTPELRSNYAT